MAPAADPRWAYGGDVTSLLRNWAAYFLPVAVVVLAERRLRQRRR